MRYHALTISSHFWKQRSQAKCEHCYPFLIQLYKFQHKDAIDLGILALETGPANAAFGISVAQLPSGERPPASKGNHRSSGSRCSGCMDSDRVSKVSCGPPLEVRGSIFGARPPFGMHQADDNLSQIRARLLESDSELETEMVDS